MPNVYVGVPSFDYAGSPSSLLDLCEQDSPLGDGWRIRRKKYDASGAMQVRDFMSMVMQDPGPVVLLGPVQREIVGKVRERLDSRVPVLNEEPYDIEAMRATLLEAVAQFEQGDPPVPLDVAVALLIIRKLDQERMWAGNSKGYMYADSIPKGRGVDERYQPRVAYVVSMLLNHGFLVMKPSNGHKKFALNPDKRIELLRMLRNRRLESALQQVLSRGSATESCRVLDCLASYDSPEDRG